MNQPCSPRRGSLLITLNLVIDCNIQTSSLGLQAAKQRFSIYLQQVESWKPQSRSRATLDGEGQVVSHSSWSTEDQGHLNGLVISAPRHLHTTAFAEPKAEAQ